MTNELIGEIPEARMKNMMSSPLADTTSWTTVLCLNSHRWSVSHILSSEVEQAFHEELHLEHGIDIFVERRLLTVPHGGCSFHLHFP